MDRCAAWFAERGFTCLEIDLGHPESVSTSEALMKHYEKGELLLFLCRRTLRGSACSKQDRVVGGCMRWIVLTICVHTELASHIRLLAIPFAPVIVARAGGTLIAQTYISSHPASALLLISPPPSNTAASQLLPTPLPEFNFEPKFPCAIMCTESEHATLEKDNRLWPDPNVDKMVVRDDAAFAEQEGLVKVEQWLDELGF